MDGSLRKRLGGLVVAGLGLSVLVGALLAFGNDGFSPLVFAVNTGVALMYSLAIGMPATLILGRLKPRIHGRPALGQWLIYLGVMLAIVLIASLVVGLVLVLVGLVDAADLWIVYRRGLLISLAISVPVTIGAASMSRLKSEKERAFALATEARLQSLESRVRPHFLFNALNSAIALIPGDPRRAEDLLERLCALLRFSIHTQVLVPLGEELRVVTDYLEIERMRFGDRLSFELDVPDDVRALEVPAFAVQTLVENSVKYAVSPRKQGAHIVVRARRVGELLAIDIADDGPGFTGEIWVSGHGLDGLRSRLDALYGQRARLVAPAPSTSGAAVRIEIQA